MTPIEAHSTQALVDIVLQRRVNDVTSSRLLVAIAGAPGSGKSTLAATLSEQLNTALRARIEASIVVPMDGFHLDNAILAEHGTQAVKGAPQSFDVGGLLSLVERLRTEEQGCVYAPLFDRKADLARNAALAIEPKHSVVLIEGNYLLLQRAGWRQLHSMFHCSIMLDVPEQVLKERLIQRWLDHGHTPADALARASSNDIPNARVVLTESIDAHLNFRSV